jgi:hypothetical protein
MCRLISQTVESMDEVAPGVLLEWLCDRQIVIMWLCDLSRSSVDAYIETSLEIIDTWPRDKPYLALKVLQPNQIMSRYLRYRTNEIGQRILKCGLEGRSAIVCPDDETADLIDMAVRTDEIEVPHMQRKTFSDQDQALDWLLQALKA